MHKFFSSNTAWYPSSQSHTIDMREMCDKPGNMYEILAFCGNCGIYSLHIFEDYMLTRFGNPTYIDGVPLSQLICCAFGCK